MIEVCTFNKHKDIQEFVPHLIIDLGAALRTGIVKDTGVEPEYNGIEDLEQITGRVHDVFEAIEARNSVLHKQIAKVAAQSESENDLSN